CCAGWLIRVRMLTQPAPPVRAPSRPLPTLLVLVPGDGDLGRPLHPRYASGRGRGRPAPSHTTGHAGRASGGSSGMPQLPADSEPMQAKFGPVAVGQGGLEWVRG